MTGDGRFEVELQHAILEALLPLGHDAILDTSLNRRGEPIVDTAEEAVAAARRISNPGCYPTGFLALVAPLAECREAVDRIRRFAQQL